MRIGRRGGADIAAIYHTWDRAGQQDISTAIWDIVHAMRDTDPARLGINFNIGHIFQDGPQDLWRINLRYAMSRVRGTGIQDVYWSKNAAGQWKALTPEAGAGAVPWVPFFQTLLKGGFSGPADLQIEYDIKGNLGEVVTLNATYWADSPQFASGNLTTALLLPSIKAQLDFYKQQAAAAGWDATQQA
jgi:sugar phosphate isomerase/epimerase